METPATTPLQLIQELLATYATRKEATERLNGAGLSPEGAGKLFAALQQSDQAIAGLMSELSQYGDAVQSEVDRTDAFQTTYKEALPRIDAMNAEERMQLFETLESNLRQRFEEISRFSTELPDSLQQLVKELENGIA